MNDTNQMITAVENSKSQEKKPKEYKPRDNKPRKPVDYGAYQKRGL